MLQLVDQMQILHMLEIFGNVFVKKDSIYQVKLASLY